MLKAATTPDKPTRVVTGAASVRTSVLLKAPTLTLFADTLAPDSIYACVSVLASLIATDTFVPPAIGTTATINLFSVRAFASMSF